MMRSAATGCPQAGEEPDEHPVMGEYLNDCRRLPPAEWLTDILLPPRARVPA
jgi:DNA gyrase inhibitor GyrI